MKFLVLGATGQTGQPLVRQVLTSGHQVVAFVRNVAGMDAVKAEAEAKSQQDQLSVVKGDVWSEEDLFQHMEGVDVVVSTLGFSIKERNITGYSKATKAVVAAMKRRQCKRLILMHSWFTKPESR